MKNVLCMFSMSHGSYTPWMMMHSAKIFSQSWFYPIIVIFVFCKTQFMRSLKKTLKTTQKV